MNMKLLLLFGAVGGAYYYFGRGTAKAAPKPPIKRPGGFYLPPLTTSGSLSQRGEEILRDPSQLEGYFSTGATPCCSNCARGLRCSG